VYPAYATQKAPRAIAPERFVFASGHRLGSCGASKVLRLFDAEIFDSSLRNFVRGVAALANLDARPCPTRNFWIWHA
jgi:hypothetical protein